MLILLSIVANFYAKFSIWNQHKSFEGQIFNGKWNSEVLACLKQGFPGGGGGGSSKFDGGA